MCGIVVVTAFTLCSKFLSGQFSKLVFSLLFLSNFCDKVFFLFSLSCGVNGLNCIFAVTLSLLYCSILSIKYVLISLC